MKPTVPEVIALARALYETDHGTVGGCLHIVLDDGNMDSVPFCLQWAKDHDCGQCIVLAEMLLRMTKTQRRKLYARYDEYGY